MFLYVNFKHDADEYIINVSNRSAAEQILKQLQQQEIKMIDSIYLGNTTNDLIALYFPTVQKGKIKLARTYDTYYDTNDFYLPQDITIIQ